MIRWAAGNYLYLLMLLPLCLFGLIIYLVRRRMLLRRFADSHIIPRIAGSVSIKLQVLKGLAILMGLTALILGLARPKWGEKLTVYSGKGIDVVIALDASKSMYATDVKPDRLSQAKIEIATLLDYLSTDRVAITAFAGECYVMCPLTTDIEAAHLFLDIISPDVIPKPGTDLGRALTTSCALFNPKEETYKALILYTDGDNLVGDPMSAVDVIKDQGVKLFTVGVGSIEGAPVPEKDEAGQFRVYKKDEQGSIVMSRLAERLLILMAKTTDGRYFRAQGLYVNRLVDELSKIKKKEIGGGEYVEYEERYQYFLIASFILIFIGIALSDRRGRWIQ